MKGHGNVNSHSGALVPLLAVSLALTGCATTPDALATLDTAATPAAKTAAPVTPATTVPGKTPTVRTPRSRISQTTGNPSPATRMICGLEIRKNVATLMALPSPPPTKDRWVNHLYTCTYQLPGGALVLSAKESPGISAARDYFSAVRRSLGPTTPLRGLAALGLPAFTNGTGTVVFLKDNTTLRVNAAALPRRVGPHRTSRANLAYIVATDVLACWTE